MNDRRTATTNEPAHIVIDKDSTARVNLGILVSIIVVAVMGSLYLQSIHHALTTANVTLNDLKEGLNQLNASNLKHAEALIKMQASHEALELRVYHLEQN